jgi:endonuclease/exonuclease/phosphatase family metal-dependent hydrolase
VPTIRLVSYNIRFGGASRRSAIADVLGALDADVVVLQEATDAAVVSWLSGAVGLPHAIAERGRSVALLTRLDVATSAWHVARPGRAALDVRLRTRQSDGEDPDLRVVGVHLSAGLSRRGERLRQVEVAGLLAALGPTAAHDAWLVGDLNSVAPGDGPRTRGMPIWLRILLRVDGGIRTDVLARLAAHGWVDGFRRLHADEPGYTLPPADPSVRLDYVLAPGGEVGRLVACSPVEPSAAGGRVRVASDHLPLLAEIAILGSMPGSARGSATEARTAATTAAGTGAVA